MRDGKLFPAAVTKFFCLLLAAMLLSSCIATRSEIMGAYTRPAEKNLGAEKVSVLFYFHHLGQQHGFDSIPKLRNQGVRDFDSIFRDALCEISNIDSYDNMSESIIDVNNLSRRQNLNEERALHDYTLDITLLEETRFSQQFVSGWVSLISGTLIPMPYSWDYTITAKLSDRGGKLLQTYERKATLDNWVQAFLFLAYAYYPLEGKREEIYAGSLHDIFKQIEAEKILKKAGGGAPASPAGS